MGEIHKSAYTVFVWLGNVGGAGQATARWAKGLVECSKRAGVPDPHFHKEIAAAVIGYISDTPILDLGLRLAWMQAEWFPRLWVIQEIALADFVLFEWESDSGQMACSGSLLW